MTLYVTDRITGEMTPLDISPLAKRPTGRVRRIASPYGQYRRAPVYYPLRKKRSRLVDDLSILVLGLGGLALASALIASSGVLPY